MITKMLTMAQIYCDSQMGEGNVGINIGGELELTPRFGRALPKR